MSPKEMLTKWEKAQKIYCLCDGRDAAGKPLIHRATQRCPICDHLIGGRYHCLPDMCCRVRKCTGCDQQIVNSSSCFCDPECEHRYNERNNVFA